MASCKPGHGYLLCFLFLFSVESAAHIEAELRIGIEEGEIRSDLDPAEEAMAIVGTIRGNSAQFLFSASHVNAEGVR
ncbi:hypothetical protein [Cupriavidus basilensis]|uniref:hypothetical protein n=1 Tax=Cupriavidus basilensis TaxID=68895 RepID=UPI002850C668|nr:hypothetical protein [Cupriavidus basilensis]MDR3383787.1 hypothetical protein [Cupriavidus basilensis]